MNLSSTQYIDFVEILNLSLDLSTIYFAHFSGCCASFVYRCHSILECCHVFWSQVEYKIVCFIYLLLFMVGIDLPTRTFRGNHLRLQKYF